MLLVSLLISALQQAPLQLDLPRGLPDRFETHLQINGKRATLQLNRRSLRADDFVLQNSDGPILNIPESRTYFGVIKELPGSAVAASLETYGLRASIFMPDNQLLRLKPNQRKGNSWHTIGVAEAPPLDMCGSESEQLKDDIHGDGNRSVSIPPPSGGGHYLSPFPWQWTLRKSRIGFDSTYDHWVREGQTVAGVTASVEYQLAENDIVCSRDGMVSYELTGIVIRQTPYYVGTTSGALLSEFANEWYTNQQHIPYESAVLLADYQNDGIAGLAYVGTLGSWGYAGLFWDRGYSPGIIAHEVGHNWGCGHIDCWPWGGSAMCGSWLLYGPESTDIILARAAWLDLPIIEPYADSVRPYADPDWVTADSQSDNYFDVLSNDYDANFDFLHISSVDATSSNGATISVVGGGPGGRDRLLYQPDRTRLGEYTDTFWYTAADFNGLEHSTPVTVDVKERSLIASFKFEGIGADLIDSSGNSNHINSSGPTVFSETHDPQIGGQCNNRAWESSSNLFDNDISSVFSSDDQGVVSSNFTTDPADGTWLEFDFGSTTTFDGIRHLDHDSSRLWIATSMLYFSQDTIFDNSDIAVEINHHSHGQNVSYPFDEISARYVRWEVTSQNDSSSTQHSLGGKELAFLYDANLVELPTPTISLSSNTAAGSPASNLIDGDINSEFVSDSQGVISAPLTTDPNDGTWVELDCQSIQTLEGLSLLDLDNSGAWTEQSRLWFSNSPTFNLSDPYVDLSHSNQQDLQIFDLPTVQARYLRWEIHGTAFSFLKNNGARELKLFSDPTSVPPFQRLNGPFDNHIEIDNKLKASTLISAVNSFTINAYVKPRPNLNDGALICGIGDPANSIDTFFEIRNDNLHFAGFDFAASLSTTMWSMLTACYDGALLSVYLDGMLLGSHATSFPNLSQQMHIAPANPSDDSAFYRGSIDELSLWNYSFDASQVQQLYIGGAATGPAPFDTERNVDLNTRLSWVSALNTPQHDVYLSTDYYLTRDADINSATYQGRQSNNYLDVQNLSAGVWYYWRVDEVHANGETMPSRIWRFKTSLPWSTAIIEQFGNGNDGDHLDGLGGGSGFAGTWSAPSTNDYTKKSGSIGAYPSNITFTEVDGYLERIASPSLPMEGQRLLDATAVDVDMSSDTNIYMSFAVRLNGSSNNMTAMVGFLDSATGNTILAGVDDGKWSITGAAGEVSGSTTWYNVTRFVVVKIEANNQGNDTIYLKFYDSLNDLVHQSDGQLNGVGSGTNEWDLMVDTTNDINVYDHLFIKAGAVGSSFGTHHVAIDEIHIGQSWNDVTGL
ncbi:MAG: hypothetical protein H8E25_13840 [Planctomycetes bacterium]|nr:hypothetical protein [Planctomycetota bacterium]